MLNKDLRKQLEFLIQRLHSQTYYVQRSYLYNAPDPVSDVHKLYYYNGSKTLSIDEVSDKDLLCIFDCYFSNPIYTISERDASLLKRCNDICQLNQCIDELLTEEK